MWLPSKSDFMEFNKNQTPKSVGNEVNILPIIQETAATRNTMQSIQITTIPTPSQPEQTLKKMPEIKK